MAPSIPKPPFMAEALKSVSALRFWYLPPVVLFFARERQRGCDSQGDRCGWAGCPLARSVRRLRGAWCVPGLQEVTKVRLLVAFTSHPSCHQCPFHAHPTLCFLPFSQSCMWPCMQEGRLMLGVFLNFHLTLTPFHGFFQRKSGLGVFLFWFYLTENKKARKFPSSLQNVAIKTSGLFS